MAGSKNHKGAAAKAAEAKRAKEAAAAAAVESDDDEEWVLDTTTPAVLDASVARVPATRKAVAAFQPPPLPELPSATRDKRGVVDETDEKRRERYDKEKALIDRARRVAEGKALTGAKIAAGPYGERRKKTSHWEYVLCEMRWMARDFAAERDWKRESARRVGCAAAASNGKPEPIKRDAKSVEAAELLRKKRTCAAVATEVARFWGKAWARASAQPIPPAAVLVPPPRHIEVDPNRDPEKSDAKETKDETARNVNETTEPDPADTGRPTRGAAAAAARSREEAEKASPTPAAATPPKAEKEDAQMMDVDKMTDVDTTAHVDDDARTPVLMTRPARAFPETPPPPPGMTAIDQWAVAKLVGDVARLKRDVVRDLLSEKEEEEEGRDGKKGKKGSKKLTAAEKKKAEKEAEKKEKEAKKKGSSRRRGGRGAAAKDDDEDEDDDEDDDDDDDAEKDADGATAADTAAKDAEKEVTDAAAVGGAADATALMPPPVPPYLPGGATDASLDAELDLDSVAPGTPPRFSETDPEAVFGSKSAVTYACSGGAASEWRRKTAQMEAAKFAAYEIRLRDWEESEKRRQRALAEARRRAEENEHIAAIETRRRRALAALAEARRFEHAAAQRAAAEAKAKALGKRGRGAMAGDSDSSDDDEDGLTLAALAGGKGPRNPKRIWRAKPPTGKRKSHTTNARGWRAWRSRGRRWRMRFCVRSCTSSGATGG